MRLGDQIHYVSVEEALIDTFQRIDKKYPAEIHGRIGKLISGLGFLELNEMANVMVKRGIVLINDGKIQRGEELVTLGSLIRPINPSPECECIGG